MLFMAISEIPHEGPMADLVWSDPDPDKEEFAISPRGAGYTFGAQVVKRFLEVNDMNHILRAHQLCMEGFSVMYDDRLSTVWSAPNYCYRCGNMASILEVGPDGTKHFNVFDAAPENEGDGPKEQAAAQQSGIVKVSCFILLSLPRLANLSLFRPSNLITSYSTLLAVLYFARSVSAKCSISTFSSML